MGEAIDDLWIVGALLCDGTGAPPRHADVAVRGDRIAAVVPPGKLEGGTRRELAAEGLVLAPGFIDVHTHDDFAAVLHPEMEFKRRGGVTTCVVGNCGMGAAPFREAQVMARAFHPGRTLPEWEGYRGYLEYLDAEPPGVNVAALVGHGTLRFAAMGGKKRAPDTTELARMKSLLAEGLEAGAVGLSTGLIYVPGKYADTDELVELATMMQKTGGLYATHMRNEGERLLDSVEEAIRIGERAGVPVQISHHKASGRDHWGTVVHSLAAIEAAQERGVDVHADQYPYTAASTILAAVLEDGGRGLGGVVAADVVIASTADHVEWEGKSLEQLGEAWGSSGVDAGLRVLADEPGATVVLHTMSEDDVRTVLAHPSTMIGSDGIPTLEGKPHPRLYGSFARVLGRYSRDEKLLALEEAVYRMTGFSASKFGLVDRGEVRPGAFADLVLFDSAAVSDRGTFEDPNQFPDGIPFVCVNGVPVVEDGVHLRDRPGRALRRGL